MTDRFEQLLDQLSPIFGIALHSDKIGACSIRMNPHLKIQLQLDITQEKLLLFCKIIEIPPGKFRENVLKETLKANGRPDPLVGVLAYLASSNHLVACQSYPVAVLNGERLASLVGAFIDMIENWYQAIHSGQSAPAQTSPSPFGLKP